ncbi:hypothetical protein ZIOFF_018849 [Zingiber officinale]|uniref:Uncharacterized protein n=1 Tax=Zingiber officinale TaxID=94328 RepID=A0A8J5H6U4_ZINOF|nr:hypothetical protein ZIOFF_018849 [Zingiber officinale]
MSLKRGVSRLRLGHRQRNWGSGVGTESRPVMALTASASAEERRKASASMIRAQCGDGRRYIEIACQLDQSKKLPYIFSPCGYAMKFWILI